MRVRCNNPSHCVSYHIEGTRAADECSSSAPAKPGLTIPLSAQPARRPNDSDGELFQDLGFSWDRETISSVAIPSRTTAERVIWRYRRTLPESVWDAAQLEGNTFTYPEVQTLLDGVTVGGHKLEEEQQVLALADSAKLLVRKVQDGTFSFDKVTSDELHAVVARYEALEWGMFRGEGAVNSVVHVALGERGTYTAPEPGPGGARLLELYSNGLAELQLVDDQFEQGLAYFLFGALHQFYYDGNKRTARFMMNGFLMSHAIDAISVPAARKLEFNVKMVDFYLTRDGTEMMRFLASCHPDAVGRGL